MGAQRFVLTGHDEPLRVGPGLRLYAYAREGMGYMGGAGNCMDRQVREPKS